ncbi:MAG: radical SAM protein [Nitrospirae bacterium]|nr:radical SAM protein [Nitrospirota bacterium]
MRENEVMIAVNSNFHHVAGENLFESHGCRFSEYRKKWKEWPEKFHVGEFPLFIDVEVTSACNLKCHFCATTFRGRKVKKGFISPDTVKKIIDEGADKNLYGVKFNIRGEPLLHPQIYDFVRYAKSKGLVDVYFNTNAMLLSEESSAKLIDAGLDRISISFEGYTKEIYERSRSGSSYETVLSNIESMQLLKGKLGVGHPKIRVQTVMLPELEQTFEEYKKFWSQRADEVGFLDYKEMKVKKKGVKFAWACPQIWQRMAIWWDGTILPCNHDDDGLLMLGNMKDISISEAWHSEKISRIREKHKRGMANEIPACDGCYLRDSEILKLMQKEVPS